MAMKVIPIIKLILKYNNHGHPKDADEHIDHDNDGDNHETGDSDNCI